MPQEQYYWGESQNTAWQMIDFKISILHSQEMNTDKSVKTLILTAS
jgi:hypothetical protein